jgi:hypothetical protein
MAKTMFLLLNPVCQKPKLSVLIFQNLANFPTKYLITLNFLQKCILLLHVSSEKRFATSNFLYKNY